MQDYNTMLKLNGTPNDASLENHLDEDFLRSKLLKDFERQLTQSSRKFYALIIQLHACEHLVSQNAYAQLHFSSPLDML